MWSTRAETSQQFLQGVEAVCSANLPSFACPLCKPDQSTQRGSGTSPVHRLKVFEAVKCQLR